MKLFQLLVYGTSYPASFSTVQYKVCFQGSYGEILNYRNKRVQQLEIPDTTCMVNSGLFVADIIKWKERNITEQLEYWTELNARLRLKAKQIN